ncbi:hypothetical protein NL676_003261 [Syzygium grande]|nr:hypothetical protein NL676_003261 [Syzygium grande]
MPADILRGSITITARRDGEACVLLLYVAALWKRWPWITHLKKNLLEDSRNAVPAAEQDEEGEARNFEFTFVDEGSELPAMVAADEIFYNGRIRPLWPVTQEAVMFNIAIQNMDENGLNSRNLRKRTSRVPLKKLMSEERDSFASCSSSEADELNGIAPEMYCAWTPRSPGAPPTRPESKSNSAHHSKRWKLKDMLSD